MILSIIGLVLISIAVIVFNSSFDLLVESDEALESAEKIMAKIEDDSEFVKKMKDDISRMLEILNGY